MQSGSPVVHTVEVMLHVCLQYSYHFQVLAKVQHNEHVQLLLTSVVEFY